MANDETESKTWKRADVISGIALLVSLVSCFWAIRAENRASISESRSRQVEASRLCYEALDLMAGKPGAEIVPIDVKLSPDRRRRVIEPARRKLLEAITLAPNYFLAHEIYGLLLNEDHDYAEAEKELRKAAWLSDDDPWACSDLATFLVRSDPVKHKSEALQNFEKVLKAEPVDPRIRMNYAVCLREYGLIEEAAKQEKIAQDDAKFDGIDLKEATILRQEAERGIAANSSQGTSSKQKNE